MDATGQTTDGISIICNSNSIDGSLELKSRQHSQSLTNGGAVNRGYGSLNADGSILVTERINSRSASVSGRSHSPSRLPPVEHIPRNFSFLYPGDPTSQSTASPAGGQLDDSDPDPDNCTRAEAKMRRTLKYYFMTPCEKYHAKGRIPYKLIMQLAKIVFITIQLILFGMSSSAHVNFTERNIVAFKHLYMKGWESTYETLPYPPASGPFAVYTYDDFFDMLDYAMLRYNNTLQIALGAYDFTRRDNFHMSLCKRYYKEGHIFAFNQSYVFDSHELTKCVLLKPVSKVNESTNTTYDDFDSRTFLKEHDMEINFDRMLDVWLNFSLKTIQLKAFDFDESPDCYRFDIKILFDNEDHDGQILVDLTAQMKELPCFGTVNRRQEGFSRFVRYLITTLDVTVIVLSLLSAVLCIRSHVKAFRLYKKTKKFFLSQYNQDLKKDKYTFLNLWYFLIIINDVLVICGSIYKIQLDNKHVDDYNMCSYMLGLGSLFVWIGVLRYIGFSFKNNILILTIKRAGPMVLRFVGCALVIYMAFALCAWVILGPYHIKFRTFYSTLECLFSLVNGDDMYTTFSIIKNDGSFTFYFSRVLLYVFISLFIYVVLNLFITLILEAYEEIKALAFNKGRQDTPMWQFIRRCPENAHSTLFRSDDLEDARRSPGIRHRLVESATQIGKVICCCRDCRNSDEDTSQLTFPDGREMTNLSFAD